MPNATQRLLRVLLQRWPLSVGQWRLYDLVKRWKFRDEEILLYVKSIRSFIYINPGRSYVARHLYYFGTWESVIARLIEECLASGMTFYDVGANIGFHSLVAARRVSLGGLVVAFEPQSACSDLLMRSACVNGFANITVRRVALSDEDGAAVIYQHSPTDDGEACLSGNELRPLDSEPVSCARLVSVLASDNIPPPDLMKIDVEGAEYKVLQGAKTLLVERPPRIIIFEGINGHLKRFGSSLAQVVKFLVEHGYCIGFARWGGRRPLIGMFDSEGTDGPENFVAVRASLPGRDVPRLLRSVWAQAGVAL